MKYVGSSSPSHAEPIGNLTPASQPLKSTSRGTVAARGYPAPPVDYRGRVTNARILVAIPAWNEEGSITQVIDQVGELVPHADVLVVDDGSTDATAQLAHEAGAQVASLPFNVGVGGAMRTAFLFAERNSRALGTRKLH